MHLRSLRDLTDAELEGKGKELKKELLNLRFQFMAGRVENPAKLKQARREIARIKTIAREKALGRSSRSLKEGA